MMSRKQAYAIFLAFFFALFSTAAFSEEEGDKRVVKADWDWDLFDGDGWTPRYAYLYKDNVIGIAHYGGLAFYDKQGSEMSGAVFRYGHGKKGKKFNVAYSNTNWWWGVDFGFSWHVLEAEHNRGFKGLEQLGLEMGIRYRFVQFIGTHTEDYSWVTLGLGF